MNILSSPSRLPDLTESDSRQNVLALLREEAEFSASLRRQSPSDTLKAESSSPNLIERPPKRRGFLEVLFVISLILATLGIIYGQHDQVAQAFPAIEAELAAYVAFIDSIKSALSLL